MVGKRPWFRSLHTIGEIGQSCFSVWPEPCKTQKLRMGTEEPSKDKRARRMGETQVQRGGTHSNMRMAMIKKDNQWCW